MFSEKRDSSGEQSGFEPRIYEPTIVICETEQEVALLAAKAIATRIFYKSDATLSLPTGNTPKGMYDMLVWMYQVGMLDTRGVRVFNLDEYYGIPKDHPASFNREMLESVINRLNIHPYNHRVPNSLAADAGVESMRYEALLAEHPVDLAVVGIGPKLTCHIGFNEPGSSADSRTRLVRLTEETRQANAPAFGGLSLTPTHAITQGIGTILEAKRIILIAKGEGKAEGIARGLQGPIGPEAPASFLRYHPAVTFIIDRQAAQALK